MLYNNTLLILNKRSDLFTEIRGDPLPVARILSVELVGPVYQRWVLCLLTLAVLSCEMIPCSRAYRRCVLCNHIMQLIWSYWHFIEMLLYTRVYNEHVQEGVLWWICWNWCPGTFHGSPLRRCKWFRFPMRYPTAASSHTLTYAVFTFQTMHFNYRNPGIPRSLELACAKQLIGWFQRYAQPVLMQSWHQLPMTKV